MFGWYTMGSERKKAMISITLTILFLMLSMGALVPVGGEPLKAPQKVIESARPPDPLVYDEIVIDLEYGPLHMEQGPQGLELSINGLKNDPRPDALSLPWETINIDLPVGTVIGDLTLRTTDMDIFSFSAPIRINPTAIPNDYTTGPLPGSEPLPPPETNMEWEIGTGIDMETYETTAKMSIKLHPLLPVGDELHLIRSGSIHVSYSYPEPFSATRAEAYDMLIIAPDAFADGLKDYRDYRNNTGTTNTLVTLEEILTDVHWDIQENDTQEEIKRFIYLARINWGVDFVMLAGDQDRIPARHVMVLDGYDDTYTSGSQDGRFVPSDLYYSDLFEGGGTDFCGWNDYRVGDSELLWGESTSTYPNRDGMDFLPDVLLGRITPSTTGELEIMLNKIIDYELNARDSVWFNNATLCGTDTFLQYQYPEGEIVSDLIANNYLTSFNITKHYESLGNLTSIASTVNRGCGFFEMADHGTYTGWGFTGDTPSGAVRSSTVSSLDNYYMLPVVVLDACLTSGFDNENASSTTDGKDPVYGYWYYPPGFSSSSRDSLAEKFHLNPDGGGIATYGATRVGWGISGYGHPTSLSGYMNTRFFKAYSDGRTRAGELIAQAVTDYRNNLGISGTHDVKTVTEYVLLGDPSLNIGGINSTNARIELDSDEVSGLPGENITVGLALNNTGILSALFELTVVSENLTGLSWDAEFTPDSMNLLPGTSGSLSLRIRVPDMALNTTHEQFTLAVSSNFLREDRSVSLRVNVERIWGLRSSPQIEHIVCGPESQIWGYADVANLGNGDEMINMTMIEMPEGWNFSFVDGGAFHLEDLNPYGEISATYLLDVPLEAVAGNYSIGLTSTSTVTPASTIFHFSVVVKVVEELLLEVERTTILIAPEETLVVDVTVINKGNSEMSYHLDLDVSHVVEWPISFGSNDISISPFSRRVIPLTITAPDGTLADQYGLTLTAAGGNLSEEIDLLIEVTARHRFTAYPTVEVISINGTNSAELIINVMNQGNKLDRYDITRVEDGTSPWSSNIARPTVTVSPLEIGLIRVDIFYMEPLNGSYSISYSIAPASGGAPRIVTFLVLVERVFNFTVTGEMQISSVEPGGVVQVSYRIRNLANCQDVFTPYFSVPQDWVVYPSPVAIDLGPGEEQFLKVNFTTSESGLAGIYSLNAFFTSLGLDSSISVENSASIMPLYSIGWVLEDDPGSVSVGPGQTDSLVITITNHGNDYDRFEIHIIGHSNLTRWLSFSDNNVRLAPGETRNITLSISIPSNATSLEYPVILLLGYGQGGSSNLTFTLHLVDSELEERLAKEEARNISIAVIIGVIILILMISGFIFVWRKGSGVDLKEAGMEWDEDEDDWDDEDYDELDEYE